MRWMLALSLLGGCSLIIDPPSPVHPEVLVNSIPNLDQGNPVAAFAAERFLVVWQDASLTPPDTSEDAVRGRFLDGNGVPLGSDFLINDPATTRLAQEKPTIAAIGSNLLVAWTDFSGQGVDATPAIRARIVSTTGDFLSPEVLVNTTLSGIQEDPAVVAGADDTFLVVWTDASLAPPDSDGEAIRGRRIDITGAFVDSSDFPVNSIVMGKQNHPSIARGADGRFFAVWTDTPVNAPSDIHGRLISGAAVPLGTDLVINTTLTGVQSEPLVTATATGYLVCWTDESLGEGDREGKAVRARLFDANGVGVGADFVINSTTRADQGHPRAAVLLDGSLFVVFEDGSLQVPDNDGIGVRARRLDSTGVPIGDDFLLNTFYGGDQEDAYVVAHPDGRVLAVWEDASAPLPDGSGDGIEARLFSAQ